MEFLDFLNHSTCNFLAVDNIASELQAAGFSELNERDSWSDLRPGDLRYVTKNGSALTAFIVGSDPLAPMAIIAAHSDSPGFRLKPNPEIACGSLGESLMVKLNTEVYGGAIWHTWFDRPLGLSGRVILRSESPVWSPKSVNVRLEEPLLVIPHLAIHFNRGVNSGGLNLSAQKDMLPLLGYVSGELGGAGTIRRLLADHLGVTPDEILDFDLTLFDVQPATTVGADSSWVNSGRLDDLAMAWAGLRAIADAPAGRRTKVLAVFDNEETGSGTKQGAHSPWLRRTLQRAYRAIGASDEDFERALAGGFLISADCAHAYHPNYPEKMDPVNHPRLGGGPVVKVNANCKYMTDADSAAAFKWLCEEAGVPVQEFVNHSDSPGGSTLGNILTGQLDIRGVDMGIGLWAMHSIRETASLTDLSHTISVFNRFFA